MEKILNFESPWIRFDQDYAFPSAVMSSDQSYRNWVYSNMLQMYYIKERALFNISYFYLGRDPNPIAYIPLVDYQQIHKRLLNRMEVNAIKFLHSMIDAEYYIACLMDEFYIPGRKSYQKKHFSHGIMTYGYDDEKELVYIAGYGTNGHFGSQTISYSDFVNAFWNVTREDDYISCFKRNDISYDLDITLMKDLLYDYIYSLNTSERLRMVQNPLTNCSWGIDACGHILSENKTDKMDTRYFYTIYEYMKLMNERYSVLSKRNRTDAPDLKFNLDNLEKQLYLLLISAIKYNLKASLKLHHYIMNRLQEIMEEERIVLEDFYRFIQ